MIIKFCSGKYILIESTYLVDLAIYFSLLF